MIAPQLNAGRSNGQTKNKNRKISISLGLGFYLTSFNIVFQKSNYVGTIDPQCEVTPVVVQAYESARFLCEQYYLSAPSMEYTSLDGNARYEIKNIIKAVYK